MLPGAGDHTPSATEAQPGRRDLLPERAWGGNERGKSKIQHSIRSGYSVGARKRSLQRIFSGRSLADTCYREGNGPGTGI